VTEMESFSFCTVGGATVDVVLSVTDPCDGRVLRYAMVAGRSGWLEDVYPVSTASDPRSVALRKRGATHYSTIGDTTLALDAETASVIKDKLAAAATGARRIAAEQNARRIAEIRATGTVRRVLRHSPAWDDAHGLTEAYPAGAPYKDWVQSALPGVKDLRVHPRCPSLAAIRQRSKCAGSFPGHDNTLFWVTDADWDLLLAETAQMDEMDRQRQSARDATEARRVAELRAVDVPADALAVFRRFHGDEDLAWKSEDESAAGMIRLYGAAIEAQGLAFRRVSPAEMPLYPPGA